MEHSLTADSDRSLAQAWEQGDEQGYDALVTRYAPLVFARCRRALGAADADDATQAVFLVLARRRTQASNSPALAAWLLTVTDHVIRNARRDRARRRRAEAAAGVAANLTAKGPGDVSDELDLALSRLPTEERTAVELHVMADHTLAEVATMLGVSLSTVHRRVQRGCARLRGALAQRGTTVSALLLMSLLVRAATAGVPPTTLVRLRDQSPTKHGLGATSVVPARVQRWSRQGMSPMNKYTLMCCSLLLVATATYAGLVAVDQPPLPATPTPAVSSQPAATVPATVPASPPPKPTSVASWWGWAHLVDGPRSAARLRNAPELVLLSEEQARHVLAVLASTRYASCRFIPEFTGKPRSTLGTVCGWLEASDAHTEVMSWAERYVTTIAKPSNPDVRQQVDGSRSYLIGDQGDEALVSFVDHRILIVPQEPGATFPKVMASPYQVFGADLQEDAVIELAVRDHLRKSVVPTQIGIRIHHDGIRLTHRAAWSTDPVSEEKNVRLSGLPQVTADRFRTLPATTIFAAALALTSERSRTAGLFDWMKTTVAARNEGTREADLAHTRPPLFDVGKGQPENGSLLVSVGPFGPMVSLSTFNQATQARINAVRRALEQVDGTLTLWIEPGTPIPVVSMSIDLGQQATADLMQGLGLVPDQDGIARHDQVSMAWRNGRLVLTTNPGGPDAVHESGGFTDNQDVRQALAAMPTPNQFKAILRPAALMHHVQAFAPLLLSAEQQQRFSAYQQRVQDSSSFAFLSMDADSKGFYLDAGGLLALIAGVVIGQSTIDPQLLLQATN